ncbi:MAG: hypothetical protein O9341_08840 [Paucibacter sp.]|nr:hypothetical protein [Roseateles sp.]
MAAQSAFGAFSPVFKSEYLTLDLDLDPWPEPVPSLHVCFCVSDAEFDPILCPLAARQLPAKASMLCQQLRNFVGSFLLEEPHSKVSK